MLSAFLLSYMIWYILIYIISAVIVFKFINKVYADDAVDFFDGMCMFIGKICGLIPGVNSTMAFFILIFCVFRKLFSIL